MTRVHTWQCGATDQLWTKEDFMLQSSLKVQQNKATLQPVISLGSVHVFHQTANVIVEVILKVTIWEEGILPRLILFPYSWVSSQFSLFKGDKFHTYHFRIFHYRFKFQKHTREKQIKFWLLVWYKHPLILAYIYNFKESLIPIFIRIYF